MKRKGFSLVELSIVLVILGLLTGGILAGQSLIRAAELRSVTSDMQRYFTAYMTFMDKYMGLPGDFNKATSFWQSAGGTGGDVACINAQTSGSAATCNGTGDGQISDTSGYTYSERFMAWKHLANAGLIEGSYTGKTTGATGTYTAVAGTNVPASKLSNGKYDIYYITEAASVTSYFTGSQFDANAFSLFGSGGYLKPEEAWGLDVKLDDGSPVYGRLVAQRPGGTMPNNCATSDADTATYNLTSTINQCIMTGIWR